MGQAIDYQTSGGRMPWDAHWEWAPERGRWTPDIGHPELAAQVRVSTDDAPPGEAFAYWRDIACYDWNPIPSGGAADFRASGMAVVARDTEYYRYDVRSLQGERSRAARLADGFNTIVIGLVLEGRRWSQSEGDRQQLATRGDLFVHDAARTSSLGWTDGAGMHLMLRRPALQAIFGPELPTPSLLTSTLSASPLAAHWRRQMASFGEDSASLPPSARSFALGQLQALTRFMLGQAQPQPLRAAAIALIEAHLADSRLSAPWLAARLGCSRATIYRAFGSDTGGIAELIADRRHAEARRRLAEAPQLPVADVALSCGLLDTANFSRSFRRRFGMSPREWRAMGHG